MIKVLIVDDEILALEDIQTMIDWEILGFQVEYHLSLIKEFHKLLPFVKKRDCYFTVGLNLVNPKYPKPGTDFKPSFRCSG